MISVFQIAPHIVEVQWPKQVSTEVLYQKAFLKKHLCELYHDSLLRIISGYHHLGLYFSKPTGSKQVLQVSNDILSSYSNGDKMERSLWKVPVCYDGKDLISLAQQKSISTAKLIQLHTAPHYPIHFYGFLPGFLYLGGLDERLATERKANPDREIEAGSVAIGGSQTGIYPSNSPGGWHVLGQTSIWMFDSKKTPPVWGNEGDLVKFFPIEKNELEAYKGKTPEKLPYARNH